MQPTPQVVPPPAVPASRRFRHGHLWGAAVLGMGAVILACLLGAFRAARHEPEFYQRALLMEPQQQQEAGEQLERSVLELHNNVRKPGRWEAVFTDEQLNGWLSRDLEIKFPQLLPTGVSAPRIALDPQQARIACRYETPKINTVVSLALEVHLTDEPNVVAIRVRKARAGALPLPLKGFLDRIADVALQSGLVLRWAQEDGDPVALFKIPSEHEDYLTQGVFLESVELRDGAVYLAGRSGEEIEIHRTAMVPRNENVQN
jgi:hypothetical protein